MRNEKQKATSAHILDDVLAVKNKTVNRFIEYSTPERDQVVVKLQEAMELLRRDIKNFSE